MASDDTLKEPGAGWQNVQIELAQAKDAMEPDRPSDTDFVSGTKSEDNKAWLDSLKRQPASGQCACGTWTTQTTAYSAERIAGRNWGLRVVFECGDCRIQREVRKLEVALARVDLPDRIRREYEAFVREHKREAA